MTTLTGTLISCRSCGCVDEDCLCCVLHSGMPCWWAEPGLCSACAGADPCPGLKHMEAMNMDGEYSEEMKKRLEDVRGMLRDLEDLGATVVYAQEAQQCDMCGKVRELRPYGPNGETICHECAASTPEMRAAAERAMKRYLD